ncbi:hypothetical protein AX16_009154 [Volvariella volvacea WC 439]|nr:hypothetical protein AX16_009154 [Volvariella volvacea WC 439]
MAIPVPPGFPIADLAGPVLIGYLLNWGLYGSLAIQVYLYYVAFPRDGPIPKALVSGLFAIETAQSIMVIHDAFGSYAKGFGDLGALNDVQLNWLSVPIFSGIVSCSVQLFFAYRIKVLSQSILIGAAVSVIALLQGSAAIAAGVQAFQVGNFSELQSVAFVSTSIWLVGSAVCDVIIAILMIYFLSKRNTGFKKTQMLVTKLIKLTVETGAITATIATLDVILFLVFQEKNYHTVPALTLAKLYSNTALAVLNSRIQIRGGRDDTGSSQDLHQTVPTSTIAPVVNVQKNVWSDNISMSRIDTTKVGSFSAAKESLVDIKQQTSLV